MPAQPTTTAEQVEEFVALLRSTGWVQSAEHDGTVLRRPVPPRFRRAMETASQEKDAINLEEFAEDLRSILKRPSRRERREDESKAETTSKVSDQLLIFANSTDTPPQSDAGRRVWENLLEYLEGLRREGVDVELHRLEFDPDVDEADDEG